MPEGDTIHRAAARLRPALAGQVVRRFEAPRLLGDRPKVGTRIDDVEAVGKHLLVHFEGGLTLQTHMRMTGSWHLYRPGERWRKAAHLSRALIEVDDWVAVCFAAPVVRTFHRNEDPVGHLGPDLCRSDLTDADIDECVERMASCTGPADEIGAVLLDQRRRLRGRQRLQVRGPVRVRRRPVHAGRRPRRRHPPTAGHDGVAAAAGQPRHRASGPPCRAAWPSTGATASRAGAAARPSAAAARASRPAAPTGARPVSPPVRPGSGRGRTTRRCGRRTRPPPAPSGGADRPGRGSS